VWLWKGNLKGPGGDGNVLYLDDISVNIHLHMVLGFYKKLPLRKMK
jgi:hypothetical protein